MSEKAREEELDVGDVLSDFKQAAHALLDAIELGLFKEVRVTRSGDIKVEGPKITFAPQLHFGRTTTGDCYINAEHLMIDNGSGTTEIEALRVEDLFGGRGLFLDPSDARRILLKDKLEHLKEEKEHLAAKQREKTEEMKELEAEIAKLS